MLRTTLRISICVLFVCMGAASTRVSGANAERAVAVTIVKADIAGRKVFVKNLDGKEETFRFASGTPVTSIAEAAMTHRASGGVGYQFVIVYSLQRGEKTATAFHYAGREEWKTTTGTLVSFDAATRRIVLKTKGGAEEVFSAGDYCVMDTGNGVKEFKHWPFLPSFSGSEVTARHTETRRGRLIHLLEQNLPASSSNK